jgi:hypothetical protein
VRVPNFSPPPPAQRVTNTNPGLSSSSNESQLALRSFAAERKRQERAGENEHQRTQRLTDARVRAVSARQNEDESQRDIRLTYDRQQKEVIRHNEDELQRNTRLANDRQQKEAIRHNEDESQRNIRLDCNKQHTEKSRQNEDENRRNKRLTENRLRNEATRTTESSEQTHERIRSISVRRRQRSLENKNRANPDRLQWPRAIPTRQKDQCLQDFVKQTSMSMLKQAVCAVCNLRTFVSSMDEYDVNQISNQARLACHPDLLEIIPGTGSVPQGSSRYLLGSK